jgi:hypothetical protein
MGPLVQEASWFYGVMEKVSGDPRIIGRVIQICVSRFCSKTCGTGDDKVIHAMFQVAADLH